ncbi:MAG: DUF481 domain-containing protein [Planctomycetota bacterium]
MRKILGVAICLLACVHSSRADVVETADGSRLIGTVTRLAGGTLLIDTAFAPGVAIPAGQIRMVKTDRPMAVVTASGERVIGRLDWNGDRATISGSAGGDVNIDGTTIVAITTPDVPVPDPEKAAETTEAIESKKSDYAKSVDDAIAGETAPPEPESKWSGRIEFGLDGDAGQTETLEFSGRAEARRVTDKDRLLLYVQGDYSEEEGRRSENELIGGARLEVDITEKFFAYGRVELEFDEFEDLDLRTTAIGGVGYRVVDEDDIFFSLRGGIGYIYEAFENTPDQDSVVLDLGYDFRYDFNEYVRLTHSFTYLPEFEDFANDFRIITNAALEIPIANDKSWKFRTGIETEYDNDPEPGINEYDTSFFARIVYDW